MRMALLSAVLVLVLGVAAMAGNFSVWAVDPLVKVTKDMPATSLDTVNIDAVSNEYESGQVVVTANADIENLTARISAFSGPAGPKPQGKLNIVGYVPIKHGTKETPKENLVATPPVELPDPLLDSRSTSVEKGKNQPIWITVYVPKGAAAGVYSAELTIDADGQTAVVPVQVTVYGFELPDDRTLHITNWFSVNHIASRHKVELWSEPFWKWLEVWARKMADYRQETVLTPLPLLIKGFDDGNGKLTFDFSMLDRWVEVFDRSGVDGIIEGGHLAGRPKGDWSTTTLEAWLPSVTMPDGSARKYGSLEIPSDAFTEYMSYFMPALQKHLEEKGWLGRYLQHLIDEPTDTNAEAYKAGVGVLKKYAPKIRIIEASMCESIAGYIDVWVPQPPAFEKKMDFYNDRKKHGDDIWFYTCLSPKGKYMNRFVDYHQLSTRLLHWVNFKYDLTGYLHWGLTYWYGDPFTNLEPDWGSGNFLPPGDSNITYPSLRGLLSSIRWEAMRDGIEDYEMLRLLKKSNPKLARQICDSMVQSLTEYSLDPVAFNAARLKLVKALSTSSPTGAVSLGFHKVGKGNLSSIQINTGF